MLKYLSLSSNAACVLNSFSVLNISSIELILCLSRIPNQIGVVFLTELNASEKDSVVVLFPSDLNFELNASFSLLLLSTASFQRSEKASVLEAVLPLPKYVERNSIQA